MKKTYIAPTSKIYAINLDENIAYSGEDMISNNAVITFTQDHSPCRSFYSGDSNAPVTIQPGSQFIDYYNELRDYGIDVYFKCFTYASNL